MFCSGGQSWGIERSLTPMSLDTPFLSSWSPVSRALGVPLVWRLGPFEASAGLGPSSGVGTVAILKTEQQHALVEVTRDRDRASRK